MSGMEANPLLGLFRQSNWSLVSRTDKKDEKGKVLADRRRYYKNIKSHLKN